MARTNMLVKSDKNPIGMLVYSMLTLTQFQLINGTSWVLCDGGTAAGSTYANITGFTNVPDVKGRTLAGKDDMGGSAANRLTSGGSGINGVSLGAVGGSETHTLSTAQLASHTHAQDAHTHATVVWGSGPTAAPNQISGTNILSNSGVPDPTYFSATAATNQNTGSDSAHNNTQPTLIANVFIKIND